MKNKLLFSIFFICVGFVLKAQNHKDTSNVTINFKTNFFGQDLHNIIKTKIKNPAIDGRTNLIVRDSLAPNFNDCIFCDLIYGVHYKGTFGSIIIPINFNYLELKGDSVSIGSAMNIGLGYSWMKGDFYIGKDDNVNFNYNLIYGFSVNTSFKTNTGKIKSSLLLGGFVGVKSVSLFCGYDPFNKNWNFGLGTKIDINNFRNDKITVWSKKLIAKFIPLDAKKIPDANLNRIVEQFE